MNISYDNVMKSMPKEKANKDALWVKLWVRPLSYPLSYLALKLGILPNAISVIAILDALLACILMSLTNSAMVITGLVLLNMFILFDCMDGTMARTLKRNSYMGEFYDALGGYVMCAFSLLAAGICAYNTGKTMICVHNTQHLIIIGAVGSVSDILSRLIYQKYTANTMIANSMIDKPIIRENDSFYKRKNNLNMTYLRLQIDRQFGTGGLFPPFLLISYFLNSMDIVIVVYALYHIFAFIAVMILFCQKATRFDKENG